jgi:hypothetical protein
MKKRSGSLSFKGMAIAFAIVLIVIVLRMAYWGAGAFFEPVEKRLERIAQQTNVTLPKLIEPGTRLDYLEAGPGKRLAFTFTFFRQISEDDKPALQKALTRYALQNPMVHNLLADDVVVWYKCHDTSGEISLEFPIKK